MTYFVTSAYVKLVLPLIASLLACLLPRWSRWFAVAGLATVVWTWPNGAEEAFSRVWAHDWISSLTIGSLLGFALWKPSPFLFFACACAGANDIVLLLCAAWLGLKEAGRMTLAVGASLLFCFAATTELGALGQRALLLVPVLVVCVAQSRDWWMRAGLGVSLVRVLLVALVPSDLVWRLGFLR